MMKSSGQIVRRYASALFELATETNTLTKMRDSVTSLRASLSTDTVEFFASPRYSDEAKVEIVTLLQQKLSLDEVLVRFLKLLLENRRITLVRDVLKSFLQLADDKLGIVRAEIVSASTLSTQEMTQFKQALTSTLKKEIEVTSSVDPSLKAGTIIKLGNTIVDASLRTRLANLKETLSVGV